jgi:hypothetical protein
MGDLDLGRRRPLGRLRSNRCGPFSDGSGSLGAGAASRRPPLHPSFTVCLHVGSGTGRSFALPTAEETLMPSLAQILAPNEREYFDLFVRAGENIVRVADLLDEMLASYPDSRHLASVIHDCEHEGDRIVHDVLQRLNHTFVTPFDREDIHVLVSVLDDIVDFTDEVADYLGVYKIEAPMEQAQQLAGLLAQAAGQVAGALKHLRGFKNITEYTFEVHRLENEADRLVRDAIGALFEGGIDPMVVIRWKDIYERLENAIDSTERAAYIIEGIVIKNA